MKKQFLLIGFLLFVSGLLSASYQQEESKIDEAETIAKINECLELSEKNRNRNNELTIEYAQKALLLSKQIRNNELLYHSEFTLGYAYYSQTERHR